LKDLKKKLFLNKSFSFVSLNNLNNKYLTLFNKKFLRNSKILFYDGRKSLLKSIVIKDFINFYKINLNVKIRKIYKFFNSYSFNKIYNKKDFRLYYNNNKIYKKFNKKFNKNIFKSNRNYFLNSFFKKNLYSNYATNVITNHFFYNNLNSNYGLKNNKLFAFSGILQYRKRRFFSFFSFFFKNKFSFFKKNIVPEQRYVKNRTSLYHVLFFGDYYRRSLFFFKNLFIRVDKFSFN
jgi:hypothetical protein